MSHGQEIIVLVRPCQMIPKIELADTQKLTGYPQLFLPEIAVLLRWKPSLIENSPGKL